MARTGPSSTEASSSSSSSSASNNHTDADPPPLVQGAAPTATSMARTRPSSTEASASSSSSSASNNNTSNNDADPSPPPPPAPAPAPVQEAAPASLPMVSLATELRHVPAEVETTARIIRRHREDLAATAKCIICFGADTDILTVCCGQPVHLNCFTTWLLNSPSCMYCRAAFPPSQLGERLQQQQEERLRIVISGPGGAPVYCEASILDGKTYNNPDGRTLYMVPIYDGNVLGYTFPNYMETVTRGEIRLGGIVVCKLSDTTFSTRATANAGGFVGDRDHTPQMGTVSFDNGRGIVAGVAGTVGPILFNDYVNTLPQNLKLPQLVEFLTRHRADNNDDAVLLQNLTLNAVVFDKSYIDGILSL